LEREEHEDYQIVYVLGAGHCGSTLLSLLLNAHSQMFGLSEISKIGRLAGQPLDAENALTRPLWRRVAALYEHECGRNFLDLCAAIEPLDGGIAPDSPLARRWLESYDALLRRVARISGKHILVDSSKSWEQLELIFALAPIRVRVLNLVRDGRAVTHAYARKGRPYMPGLRKWHNRTLGATRLRAALPADRWLDLSYERLATSPEVELRRVCAFVGVPYEPGMLAYREADWNGIGGNRMQRRTDSTISLDTAWQREMPLRHRALFRLHGARLNRTLGYR
jgi:hypothetical protein